MNNIVQKFAVAALALSVSAAALSPMVANAATAGTAKTDQAQYNVPNNVNGPHGARKAYDIWLASHANQEKNAKPQAASHDIVPNNTNGPNGGRKEHDIWKSKQDQKAKPDAAVLQSNYQQQGIDVLQNLRAARVALDQNNLVKTKSLLQQARSDLANMQNAGIDGHFKVVGPTLVSQDYVTTFTETTAGDKVAVVQPALTNIASTDISIPFSQTKQKLNLAYTQLINSHPHQAKMTLADAENSILVQSDFIVAGPQAS